MVEPQQVVLLIFGVLVITAAIGSNFKTAVGGTSFLSAVNGGLALGATMSALGSGWDTVTMILAITWGVFFVLAFVGYLISIAFEKGRASRHG